MSDQIIKDVETRMQKSVDATSSEFGSLRTGRASASMLDGIMVDAYGSKMPVAQVGTVSVPEPRTVSVQVWDSGLIVAVETAIRDSSLGLNPIVDGALIRVPIPELNEERRREIAKIAHQYAENGRVAVRHVRRDGLDAIKAEEGLSEDDSRRFNDQVQKLTNQHIEKIDRLLSVKEEEIMQV